VLVAALYDVHGNLPALEAVLADPRVAGADLIVSGGDLVAGPTPSACFDLLAGLGSRVVYVRGNADRLVAERVEGFGSAWCADELGEERLAVIATWPLTLNLDVAGGATFCHATPRSDEEIVTARTPAVELADALEGATHGLVVAGHTHMQVDRFAADGRRFVCAGSVGRPYEGVQGAFWAVLDDDGVELVRTEYDVRGAAKALAASEWPAVAEHVELLLEPPDPDEVSAYFETRRGA
jgi:predicted phosphodiesterase